MLVNLRVIKPEDNNALANMIKAVFVEHNAPKEGTVFSDPTTNDLFRLFKAHQSILWVAEIDGVVLGCCGIYPTPNLPNGYAELVKFYLDKSIRKKGIGLQLFEKSIASAKALGYTHLYIESLPEYANAVKMYQQFGFQFIDAPLGNSGHTSCSIWMEKEL
jgi:putative acetyltransferase